MMFSQPSALSLAAAGLYCAIAVACLSAALAAVRNGRPPAHLRAWSIVALLFLALAAMRVVGLEEWLRDALRDVLRERDAYDGRREMQRYLAAGMILLASVAMAAWVMWVRAAFRDHLDPAVMLAWCCVMAMFMLMILRLISLHYIDALLYGSLKLNWVVDIGASIGVLLAALVYRRQVKQAARPGRVARR
jgi:hypothetical protein